MEHVVADGQVVLQAERLQHYSVPDRERQPQLLVGVSWEGRGETCDFHLSRFCIRSNKEGGAWRQSGSPGGGGSAVIFGFMSGANGGFTSGFGDRYGGIPLPGVIGGVGFPGTGEWG